MNPPDARRSGFRPLWWIAFVVIAVAIAAAVIYSQKHGVAKRIANMLLQDYGFETTHVSVGRLSHDVVLLDELVVVSDGGDRYALYGVALPSIAGRGGTYSVERLAVTRSDVDRPAAAFGEAIDALLNLPEALAGTEIRIGELRPFDDLVVHDVAWSWDGTVQTLALRFEDFAFNVDVRPSGSAAALAVIAEHPASTALSAELELGCDDGIYRARGPATIDASPWMQVLQSLDVLPQDAAIADAVFSGSLAIAFDEEVPGTLAAGAELELASDASFTLGTTARIAVRAPMAPILTYRYPDDEWRAQIGILNLGAATGGGDDVPIALENVDCLLGVHCRSEVRVVAERLHLGEIVAGSVDLRFNGALDFGEVLRIAIADDATATIEGLETPAFAAESLALTSIRSARAAIADDDWRWHIGELGIAVRSLEAVQGLVLSFPVTLRESGFDSTGDHRAAKLAIAGENGGLRGMIDWQEEARSGKGSLRVREFGVDFSRTPLSDYLPDPEHDIDIVRGTWLLDGDLSYEAADSGTVYRATATHDIDGLAGRLGDTVFAGVNGRVETRFDSGSGDAAAAGDLAAGLLEVGLPIENLRTGFAADVGRKSVQFESVAAEILGGGLTVEPFTWHATGEPQTAMLQLDAVQLGLIVELLDLEDIEMDGAVSGGLPVRITGTNMTIADGKLESDAPGGAIRYGAGTGPVAPESDLAFVTEALRNFEFETLSSAVDYGDNGDLVLQMRLTGISPDVDPLQPVILNLSVENNVPQMLRSLQAVRSIQDILERKTLQ